jgi:hypothetical protein
MIYSSQTWGPQIEYGNESPRSIKPCNSWLAVRLLASRGIWPTKLVIRTLTSFSSPGGYAKYCVFKAVKTRTVVLRVMSRVVGDCKFIGAIFCPHLHGRSSSEALVTIYKIIRCHSREACKYFWNNLLLYAESKIPPPPIPPCNFLERLSISIITY